MINPSFHQSEISYPHPFQYIYSYSLSKCGKREPLVALVLNVSASAGSLRNAAIAVVYGS